MFSVTYHVSFRRRQINKYVSVLQRYMENNKKSSEMPRGSERCALKNDGPLDENVFLILRVLRVIYCFRLPKYISFRGDVRTGVLTHKRVAIYQINFYTFISSCKVFIRSETFNTYNNVRFVVKRRSFNTW